MREFVMITVFTLFVCFLSIIFIFIPSSKGLFIIGEPLFFLSALLFGPFAGAFVGGVGFALADLLLGYPHYIIAALAVKASAGFIVGKVNRCGAYIHRFFSIASDLLLISLFMLVGITIYSGDIYFGYIKTFFLGEEVLKSDGLEVYKGYIPNWFWVIASIIITFFIFWKNSKDAHNHKWTGVSLLSGCLIIVFGYFIHETFILPQIFGVKVDAVANFYTRAGESILSATIAFLINKIIHFKTP
ncbi:MAG: ECF transporter S component [Candidatus Bathyarchaeia archaeon]